MALLATPNVLFAFGILRDINDTILRLSGPDLRYFAGLIHELTADQNALSDYSDPKLREYLLSQIGRLCDEQPELIAPIHGFVHFVSAVRFRETLKAAAWPLVRTP